MPLESTHIPVRCVEDFTEEEPNIAVIVDLVAHSTSTATLQQLMRAMKWMAEQMEKLQENYALRPHTGSRRPPPQWPLDRADTLASR